MKDWHKILIGMGVGATAGFIFGEKAASVEILGTIFLRMIKMLVVPLVFCSLIAGITALNNPSALARMGIKTLFLFIIITLSTSALGIVTGEIIGPGRNVNLPIKETGDNKTAVPSLEKMVMDIVPQNPFEAFASGNMLQVIFFAMITGISIVLAGDRARPIITLNESLMSVIYKMVHIVMLYAPIGVFGLMAAVTGKYGQDVFEGLFKLAIAMLAGLTVIVIIYGAILRIIARINLTKFFFKITEPVMVAFSTASSSATLPVTMRIAKDKLGISEATASFVMPLGVTMNKTASAFWQALCAVFAAQLAGIELSSSNYLTIISIATLVSFATGAIPSGGLVVMSVTLSSVNLPLGIIAIIGGVDRIFDIFRTVVNVIDDLFVGILVDKSEKTFDETKFKS